ncbi:MAG: hypothetical protein R3211_12160, partial [Balneolaceae bacterium]|nr:hypothetical protein [Balneolaceae bacterium]
QIEIDYKDNTASLEVRQFGRDFYSVLRGIIKSLEAKNTNAIYIDLPLEDPLILNVIEKIRHMGFIFSGLIPLYHGNKDYLRMQKIYLEIDFNYIELYSDMAKRIKKIIRQEYHEYHEV